MSNEFVHYMTVSLPASPDVPGPLPGLPYTRDVGVNWVSLAWPRPLYNGGAPILSYKVEAWLKCEDAMWDMVSTIW